MPHAIFITGQQITAFDASRPEDKITDGWLQVTPEQFAAAQDMARPQWDGAQAVEGPEPPAAIPPITPRQLRLWLILHGVTLAQVDALIASIPDPAQREATRITWEYSIEFDRPHPLIAQFGAVLGFDSIAMDAAFREASQL